MSAISPCEMFKTICCTSPNIFDRIAMVIGIFQLGDNFIQRRFVPPTDDRVLSIGNIEGRLFFQQQGITWPWPRQMYAPIVDYCRAAGARGLVFDILFTEASSYGGQDDETLAQAVGRAQNCFLPLFFSRNQRPGRLEDLQPLAKFCLQVTGPPLLPDPGYQSVIAPMYQSRKSR